MPIACLCLTRRTRYSNRDIYTAVGSILVAINPYERIHSLYDEDRMRSYADMATDEAISPHPYALMELAYRYEGFVAAVASPSRVYRYC